MSFANKIVIITGASSGIGAETAKEFAKEQAKLVLIGRNEAALQEVSTDCKTQGSPDLLTLQGDLTDSCFVQSIITQTIARFNKLDALINNAGILENGTIETTDLTQYDKVMNINVRSIYQLTNLAVPHLIATQGAIVNVSSVTGLRAFPNVLAYCMSKAAVDQFTRCIALELAPKGVRVNCVNPGVVVTNLHRRGGLQEEEYAAFIERCKDTQPLGRAGDTIEVAKAILFMASDNASFITAVNLPVDGGKQASCPR